MELRFWRDGILVGLLRATENYALGAFVFQFENHTSD